MLRWRKRKNCTRFGCNKFHGKKKAWLLLAGNKSREEMERKSDFLVKLPAPKIVGKFVFPFLLKPHRILSFRPCLRTTFWSASMSLLRLWKELVGSESGMVSVSELKLFCLSPCCHNEDDPSRWFLLLD